MSKCHTKNNINSKTTRIQFIYIGGANINLMKNCISDRSPKFIVLEFLPKCTGAAIKNITPCFSHMHFTICLTHFSVKLFETLVCYYFDVALFIENITFAILTPKFSNKC